MQHRTSTAGLVGFTLTALAMAVASERLSAAETSATEHVEVVGQAASIDQALKEQRSADSIKSVVHADGVAQLPDENDAEAVQRLPGISVERDQGEGRFVSVRGLGPDLNSVTINSTLVPAPESERRAVALDVLPSELVQSLSVIKTLTPDMDANSLGGTVDVKSLSAFDHEGLFYTGSSEASYDKNTAQTSPKFSGAISDRFSLGDGIDNFGVAAALSWQKRDFGSDNVETGGAWDFEQGSRLEELEQRDYDIRRERAGGGLNFDYKPDDFSSYYLRTLYSRYKDSETRNAASIAFDDPQAPGEIGPAEGERKLKQREETQQIQSYVLGGERLFGLWTLSGQAGYSESSEDSPGHIAGATFQGIDGIDGGFYDSGKPRPIVGPGFYDPANFSLDKVDWERQKTTDTEKNLRLDLARDYDVKGYASQVKFGGKVSRRDKDNDLDAWVYEDFDDLGFTDEQLSLGQLQKGNVDYRLGRFGPGISAGAIKQLLGGLDRDEFFDEQESRVNDFKMSEDINAAYLMNTVDIDDWRFIAGMRYEGTEFEAKGTGATDGVFTDTDTRRQYHHWLPGLHARYQLDKNTQVRAAWTKSVVRPTFGQLAPGLSSTMTRPPSATRTSSPWNRAIWTWASNTSWAAPAPSRLSCSTRTYRTSSTTPTWPAPAPGPISPKPTVSPMATVPSSMAWNWLTRKNSIGCRRRGTACCWVATRRSVDPMRKSKGWTRPVAPSASAALTCQTSRIRSATSCWVGKTTSSACACRPTTNRPTCTNWPPSATATMTCMSTPRLSSTSVPAIR